MKGYARRAKSVLSGFAWRYAASLGSLGVGAAVSVGALIAMAAHLLTYGSCRSIGGSNNGRPDPGTPAAAYCTATWHFYDWILFAAAGATLSFLAYLALRPFRPKTRLLWSTAVVITIAVAHAVVVSDLRDYFGA